MWSKKELHIALVLIVAVVATAEPPAPAYGPPGFSSGFRPAFSGTGGGFGHGFQNGFASSGFASNGFVSNGFQGGFQGGYQSGFQNKVHGGYQGGYKSGFRGGYQDNYDNGAPEPFSFQYTVQDPHTGADFGHHATSDGRQVHGQYHVLLPDGRRQIVKYVADENGYNADVQYEGEAHYQQPAPSTQYGAYKGGFTGGNSGYQGSGFYSAPKGGYTGGFSGYKY